MPGLSQLISEDRRVSSANNNTLQTTTLAWATVLGESVSGLAWSSDEDRLYAACVDGELVAYDIEGETLFRKQLHNDAITAVAVQPGGNLLATSGEDGKVVLSDAKTGIETETMLEKQQWPEVLSWSPDGRALAGAVGKMLFVRNDDGSLETWDGHPGFVGALSWAPLRQPGPSCPTWTPFPGTPRPIPPPGWRWSSTSTVSTIPSSAGT